MSNPVGDGPPSVHYDYDQLAQAAIGLLDAAEVARIEEHLAECSDCSSRNRDLQRVGVDLSALDEEPMPGSVIARLDRVIAAEVSARAQQTRAGGNPLALPGTNGYDKRVRRRLGDQAESG